MTDETLQSRLTERFTHRRYVVFLGDDYYPLPGAYDILCCCDSLQEIPGAIEGKVRSMGIPSVPDWAHAWDTQEAQIIELEGVLQELKAILNQEHEHAD